MNMNMNMACSSPSPENAGDPFNITSSTLQVSLRFRSRTTVYTLQAIALWQAMNTKCNFVLTLHAYELNSGIVQSCIFSRPLRIRIAQQIKNACDVVCWEPTTPNTLLVRVSLAACFLAESCCFAHAQRKNSCSSSSRLGVASQTAGDYE